MITLVNFSARGRVWAEVAECGFDPRIDEYLGTLPDWQREICERPTTAPVGGAR
jgi:hypothetical protein